MGFGKLMYCLATAGVTAALFAVAGCGSTTTTSVSPVAASSPPATTASPAGAPGTAATPPQTAAPPGALTGEAASAAAGDIPDNQVFLTFLDTSAGFSMKYPEGWAQRGRRNDVTFRDKNNIVHVSVSSGPAPTPASVSSQIAALKAKTPSLTSSSPTVMMVSGRRVIKVTYSTKSAPNPVTGKRVALVVDRYYLGRAGKVAVVDLGTARGVDNVDAYRLMIESFRWKG